MSEPPIILFDGVCNLCSGFVTFIITRDPRAKVRFASLQSDVARQQLKRVGYQAPSMETVMLIKDGRVYERSGAALRIFGFMKGLWPLLKILLVVPRPLRDWVYGVIARNRYRWFGRKESCMSPTPELRQRFLDG